jgi:hypothetical protein
VSWRMTYRWRQRRLLGHLRKRKMTGKGLASFGRWGKEKNESRLGEGRWEGTTVGGLGVEICEIAGGCGWPGEGDCGWGEQEQEQRGKWGETAEREKDLLREWEGLVMVVGGCERRRRWWNGRWLFFIIFLREEGLRLRKRNGFRVFYL